MVGAAASRRSRSGSAPPTRATTPPPRPPARPTTCSPTASAPATTVPSLVVGRDPDQRSRARRSTASRATFKRTLPASRPSSVVGPAHVRQHRQRPRRHARRPHRSPRRPQDLIDRSARPRHPGGRKRHHLRSTSGARPPCSRTSPTVLRANLPLFLAVVVLLGCLLLMVAFRSVVIPLTAAVMNVLAAGAAFGVVVAVFQWGWGSNAIGLGAPGPIESFLPVMLIAILFGLSMDYQVFLVSRIHEEWLRTRRHRRARSESGRPRPDASSPPPRRSWSSSSSPSSSRGAARSASSASAWPPPSCSTPSLLRTVLVPAAMHLLGDRNWWLPALARPRSAPHRRRGSRALDRARSRTSRRHRDGQSDRLPGGCSLRTSPPVCTVRIGSHEPCPGSTSCELGLRSLGDGRVRARRLGGRQLARRPDRGAPVPVPDRRRCGDPRRHPHHAGLISDAVPTRQPGDEPARRSDTVLAVQRPRPRHDAPGVRPLGRGERRHPAGRRAAPAHAHQRTVVHGGQRRGRSSPVRRS